MIDTLVCTGQNHSWYIDTERGSKLCFIISHLYHHMLIRCLNIGRSISWAVKISILDCLIVSKRKATWSLPTYCDAGTFRFRKLHLFLWINEILPFLINETDIRNFAQCLCNWIFSRACWNDGQFDCLPLTQHMTPKSSGRNGANWGGLTFDEKFIQRGCTCSHFLFTVMVPFSQILQKMNRKKKPICRQ